MKLALALGAILLFAACGEPTPATVVNKHTDGPYTWTDHFHRGDTWVEQTHEQPRTYWLTLRYYEAYGGALTTTDEGVSEQTYEATKAGDRIALQQP